MSRKERGGRRSRQKLTFDANASAFEPSPKQDKRQLEADLRNFVKFKYKEEPLQPVFRRRDPLPTLSCITISPYFRFALKFAGSFSVLQADPNCVLDWGKVSKVARMTYDQYQCPICLESSMTAPRISKCGHCFCYPCILRYFIQDGERHKRCPVCFDTIKKSWLRPVEIQLVEALQEKKLAQFVLLRRVKGAIALERCGMNSTGHTFQGFFESRSNQALYNRITLHLDEKRDLEETLAELERLSQSTDWDNVESKAIQSAIETLKARLELQPKGDTVQITNYFPPACSCNSVYHPLTLEFISSTPCSRHVTETERPPETSSFALSSLPEVPEPPRNSEQFIYFYTLEDGQPVFLHPLNISMLKREYELYANFPQRLVAPVLELQRVVMTEAEQRRQKDLGHLAIGSVVYYVEVDLSRVVSNATLHQFKSELTERVRRREELRRKEARLHDVIEKRKRAEDHVYKYTHEIKLEPVLEPTVSEETTAEEPARGIWGAFREVIAKEPVRPAPKPVKVEEDLDDQDYHETKITLGQLLGL